MSDFRESQSLYDLGQELNQIAPEMIDLIKTRLEILRIVKLNQPIGRRGLTNLLDMTERVIRREANVLKDYGLLEFSLEGMTVTDKGEATLDTLEIFFHSFEGLSHIERELQRKLNVKKIIIGSYGNLEPEISLKEIGIAAAKHLESLIKDDAVVGITGGTSMRSVVDGLKQKKGIVNNVMVVPARGGLGRKAEFQANTIVEILANKIGGDYRLLFLRDSLSEEAVESLLNDPEIKEIKDYIKKINTLVFGIGRASTMASRRGLEDELVEEINQKGAVAEAFGHYFNMDGEIVHEISTIGIDLDKFKSLENLIAIAGDVEKVEAIISICKLNSNLVLVINEEVAKELLIYLQGGN